MVGMLGVFAGPVHTSDFMEKFMPANTPLPPKDLLDKANSSTLSLREGSNIYEDLDILVDEFCDPFSVPASGERPMEHTLQKDLDTQGQLIVYSARMLARQHRTFAISLFVCGSTARFIRWDYGGSTVSESFNHVENPRILTEYQWRHGQLTRLQGGFDPTVRLADSSEAKRFMDAIKNHQKYSKRKLPDVDLKLMKEYPTSVITVRGTIPGETTESREYIVRAPVRAPSSLVGQTSRVFYALDVEADKLVCLKEYLRSEHRHHRVVQELLYPLSSAGSSKELTQAIGNAITYYTKVHDSADVSHDYASPNNIMLRLNGEGVLTDSDHAIIDKTGMVARERTPTSRRTSTWQYLSVGLAKDPTKEHNILDVLESCYWVFLYQGIHYFRSTAYMGALYMFDEHRPKHVLAFNRMDFVGGSGKRCHFDVTSMHDAYIRFDSQPFHHLHGRLTAAFRRYHMASVYEEMEEYEAFLELHAKYLKTLGKTMLEYINEALQSEAWPPSDAIPDRFPRFMDTQAEAYMNDIQQQSYSLQVSTTDTGGVSHKPLALNGPVLSFSSRSTQKRARRDEDEDVYSPGGTNSSTSKTNPSKRIKTMSPPKTPQQSSDDDDAPRPRPIAGTMPPPPTRSRAQTSSGTTSGSRQPIRRTTSATRTRFSSRIAARSSNGPRDESEDVIMAPPPPPPLPRATTSRSRTLSSPRAKNTPAQRSGTRSRGSKQTTSRRTRFKAQAS
ncbi:hypothetical protein BXZ70DRAFT_1078132 [Cristinia sonorae]|uniref:Fungal-type protein kinase domain-containing protein n=1 Tax=Cristinia sonorae TaxID=1940300 RepID=A0A8K0UM62_9AGAR|nr:hypothetical protein BXZ70DRAFT_1078132 [Cristinia sonorae]